MRGLNKVMIIGSLGRDPEFKHLPSGDELVLLSVATNETWKDKQTGEQQKRTEWHRVVLFRHLAKLAHQYLKKGSQVYVEGRLQTKKYTNRDGTENYSTEIVGGEMQMLGSKDAERREPQPVSPPIVDDLDDHIPF